MTKKAPHQFIVCFDDQTGLCVPMQWDEDCQGAICAGGDGAVALFPSRKAARTAISISTRWNALLRAQGQTYIEDFFGECRKQLRLMKCNITPA